MKDFDSTEQAYRNGYAKGYEDGKRDAENKRLFNLKISEETKTALEAMGQKAHGGNSNETI